MDASIRFRGYESGGCRWNALFHIESCAFERNIDTAAIEGVSSRRLRGMSGANLLILDHGAQDDARGASARGRGRTINNPRLVLHISTCIYTDDMPLCNVGHVRAASRELSGARSLAQQDVDLLRTRETVSR